MTMALNYGQAICWGKFIEIAYSMYSPGVTNPQQPKTFPSRWQLVKNINAEAMVGFVQQKEFMGFVAQCLDEPSKFAVVLHGTESVYDFLDDLEFLMSDFTLVPNGGRTETGFTRLYESLTFVDPVSGASQSLNDYLNTLHPTMSFTIAGHSVGGALATLHSVVLASRNIPVATYTFASPMVGDSTFVNTYNALVPKSYRIVNKPDIVPQLPGTWLGYQHVNMLFEFDSLNFPEIQVSFTCFHSLNVYIYMLEKLAGSANPADLGSCKA